MRAPLTLTLLALLGACEPVTSSFDVQTDEDRLTALEELEHRGRRARPRRRELVEASDADTARRDSDERLFGTFWWVASVSPVDASFADRPVPLIRRATARGWRVEPDFML